MAGRESAGPREELVVRSDGTPLIQSTPHDNLSLADLSRLERPHCSVLRTERTWLPAVWLAGEHETPGFFSSQAGWAQRIKVFVDEREPTVNWFFVHDGKPDGAGYFVGYERESNRRVGFIGMSGFRPDPCRPTSGFPCEARSITDYSYWSSAPASIYSGREWVHADLRRQGRAAAIGLCAIRKPPATSRPRRADGNDRL